ncbi:unnamed protein product [Penicillium pancosmium]
MQIDYGAQATLAKFTATLTQQVKRAQPHFSAQQPREVLEVRANCFAVADFSDLEIKPPKFHYRKAPAIVVMATSQSTAFQHVLATFKTKVDRKLVSEFEMTTLSDLKLALASIQRKHASDRRVRDMGRLNRFLDAMDQYGKVIEVFLNATDVLAFVWGPMKFLLQAANTFSEAFGKLLETYQIIGESLPLLDKCQGFLEDTPYVRQALESIFHDILEFHQYALGYFKKPMWQRVFQATWATYKTRFQPIVDNLYRHKDLLEGRVTFTQLETVILNGEKTLQELQKQQRDEAMSNYRDVQGWLGNVNVETDHESIARVRCDNPEAGSWLLRHPLFQPWQDATSDTLLLWLNGIPGAGKSVLASLIIDKCRERASNVTIWFYCRHGDKSRSTFVGLARALISQLLKNDMDLVPYVHEKMSSRSEQILSSEFLAKELLETLLKNCRGLYIILDGLDECGRGEEKSILEWFRSVIEESSTHSAATSGRPRCVFISQRDAIATKFLRGLPTIVITLSNNLHDITAFVSSWGRKIQEKFSISVDDTNWINEMVVERSAALFSQISRERLYNEVNVKGIPEGLEAAYSRVLDVVLEQTSRTEAVQLLAWLVCAKRPLEWREIQAAVAIDIEGETVDFHGRQWMVTAKDLCGSLVEIQSDGSLDLVHTTAKFYLIENGVIDVSHEELKIACLCLNYLSLPGFEAVLAESSVEDLLKIGYFAFVDYAACYWTSHLRAGLVHGTPEEFTGMQIGHLGRFIDSHYRPPAEDIQIPEPTRNLLGCLQESYLDSCDRFEDFLKVFVATERQVETYGEGAASNIALDIPDRIARIRAVLEDTARRQSWDEIDRRLFTSFYGEEIYKCPRMSCSHFHRGFMSPKERESHIQKHTLQYSCSYPGCLRAALGFPSPSELQRHILQAHEMAQAKTQMFPSKRKKPVVQCGICQQRFSKPGQLRTHDCRNDDTIPRSTSNPNFVSPSASDSASPKTSAQLPSFSVPTPTPAKKKLSLGDYLVQKRTMATPLSQSVSTMTHFEQQQRGQGGLSRQMNPDMQTSPVAQGQPQMAMGMDDPHQQAANPHGRSAQEIEELFEAGRNIIVKIPEMEHLETVQNQMKWTEEAARKRGQYLTLKECQDLIVSGEQLGLKDNNEHLFHFREMSHHGEAWEAKAKELMSAEMPPYQQLEALFAQASPSPVSPETLAAVDSALTLQRKAQTRIETLYEKSKDPELKNRPTFEAVCKLMESVKRLKNGLIGVIDIEREQKNNEDWLKKGKKLFGKANAPTYILKSHMWDVKRRNSYCFNLEDRPPVEQNTTHDRLRDSPVRSIFDLKPPEPRVFCICRESEAGMMIECESCHEWYHGKCLKIARGKVKELDRYACPICDWRQKIPRGRGTARPRLEDLLDWQAEMASLRFQPDEKEVLEEIISQATAFRDFLSGFTNATCTTKEVPKLIFYLRKIEGAEVFLGYETNFFRQEVHKLAPVAPEPPPILGHTRQQKIIAPR